MSAEISLESKSHAVGLRVVVRGPATYATTLAYWQAIAAEIQLRQPAGLLLIDETTGELSAADWKKLVEDMAGRGLEKTRIAHVKPHGLQQIEHCELFAREAGLDARVFTNETEAAFWLRYGERAASN